MSKSPIVGRAAKDHKETVARKWGEDAPDWVIVLAEQCNLAGQSAVGESIGYTGGLISAVLGRSYGGDLARVEEMVRGRYMAVTVRCPVMGDLARNDCMTWQRKPFATTNSHRVRMYHACRNGCQHSRITTHQGDD